MDRAELSRHSHANLVESVRRLAVLNPEAVVEVRAGTTLIAGGHPHPVIDNAAMRVDDSAEPADVLAAGRAFFGELGRGFSVWVRDGAPEDASLKEAGLGAGLRDVYGMPQMVVERRVKGSSRSGGPDVRRVTREEEVAAYWRLTAQVYRSLDFPPEMFEGYVDREGLLAPDIAAFLAYLDDEPVAAAMTVVTHGVAGIFWVGALERARGRGLARACTAAAVNAGFDLGADFASLQASAMGAPMYTAMGFETLYAYRLLLCSAGLSRPSPREPNRD